MAKTTQARRARRAHGSPRSLASRFPKRVDIPLQCLASLVLLIAGLTLPVIETKKLVFWKSSYTIIDGIVNLWKDGHYVLSILIFVFSIIFPAIKLSGQGWLWFQPFDAERRQRWIRAIRVLGKWSMLDVFVIAVIVVITQTGGLLDATPRLGIYLFGAAISLSMIVTMQMDVMIHKIDASSGKR
jgi:paraquat-inducible protein A